jgi:hypothetical protein
MGLLLQGYKGQQQQQQQQRQQQRTSTVGSSGVSDFREYQWQCYIA